MGSSRRVCVLLLGVLKSHLKRFWPKERGPRGSGEKLKFNKQEDILVTVVFMTEEFSQTADIVTEALPLHGSSTTAGILAIMNLPELWMLIMHATESTELLTIVHVRHHVKT